MKHLKEEFDKLTFKEVLMYALAFICIIAGFTLLFMSLFIPPEGEIHESVLTAFGLILVFVGTVLGVDMHYSGKVEQFKEAMRRYIEEALATGGLAAQKEDRA